MVKEICPFCDRIDGRQFDQLFVGFACFEPINPVTPGHRLFVTVNHFAPKSLEILDAGAAIFQAVRQYRSRIKREHEEFVEDYNLIINAGENASQTVEHFHAHYVPRRKDDGLLLPWSNQIKG